MPAEVQRRVGVLMHLQEQAKSRRRRQVKSQRAVVGASLDVIKERRSQRPEARSAARAEAIKQGKEKRTAAQSVKKAEKAKTAAKSAAGQTTGRYVQCRRLVKCDLNADSVTVLLASRAQRVPRRSQSLLLAELAVLGRVVLVAGTRFKAARLKCSLQASWSY